MCPSFRATGDEKDSTRGRARVLQEVVRGTLPITDPGVGESLDLCLSCKACSSDCPTGVDMAAYKAETLHRRYRRRVRPMAHYSLGLLPLWLRGTTRAAGPLNALMATRAGRAAARLGGVSQSRTLPRFASARDLRAELARVPGSVWRLREPGPTSADVVLFLDSFTRGLRPTVAGAAAPPPPAPPPASSAAPTPAWLAAPPTAPGGPTSPPGASTRPAGPCDGPRCTSTPPAGRTGARFPSSSSNPVAPRPCARTCRD